jgi:hypothetical protein
VVLVSVGAELPGTTYDGFWFETNSSRARLHQACSGYVEVPPLPFAQWTTVVLDIVKLTNNVAMSVYYDNVKQTVVATTGTGPWRGVWKNDHFGDIVLGARCKRNSGAFDIEELSYHEGADIYAATTLDGSVRLSQFEEALGYIPTLVRRTFASVSSTSTALTLTFDEPMPSDAYQVFAECGSTAANYISQAPR